MSKEERMGQSTDDPRGREGDTGKQRVASGAAGGDLPGRLSLVSPDVPPHKQLWCLPSTTATPPFHFLLRIHWISTIIPSENYHNAGTLSPSYIVPFNLYLPTQEHSRIALDRSGASGTTTTAHMLGDNNETKETEIPCIADRRDKDWFSQDFFVH